VTEQEKPDTRLEGDGWSIWTDRAGATWDFSGQPGKILSMLYEEFPSEKVERYYDTTVEYGRLYGMLYEDALAFLLKWGIKATVVGLEPLYPERPPS
jgi:hypothetical protein